MGSCTAAAQRSIRIVCELLEAGMFGLVYGSFMINEVDIVFSKWTQVFILTVEQLYPGAPGYSYSGAGNVAGCVRNVQH